MKEEIKKCLKSHEGMKLNLHTLFRVGGSKEKPMTCRRFDNSSSERKGRDTATFPINELWDLSDTAT